MIRYKILFIILAIHLYAIESAAINSKLDIYDNLEFVDVKMPHLYYQKDKNDIFFFVYQESYVIFEEENSNLVVVTGPLQPCIAVAITNGKKLLFFHISPYNKLQNMKEIIVSTFVDEDKNNIYAGIYGLNAEKAWKIAQNGIFHWFCEKNSEPANTETTIDPIQIDNTTPNYNLNSHSDFIKAINAIIEECQIARSRIKIDTWDLEQNPILENTRYSHSQHNICIKMSNLLTNDEEKNINIFSISLMEKNLFNIDDKHINIQINESKGFSGKYKNIELYKNLPGTPESEIRSLRVKGFYQAFNDITKEYLITHIPNRISPSINSLDFINQTNVKGSTTSALPL